jgi:hypothetical protein
MSKERAAGGARSHSGQRNACTDGFCAPEDGEIASSLLPLLFRLNDRRRRRPAPQPFGKVLVSPVLALGGNQIGMVMLQRPHNQSGFVIRYRRHSRHSIERQGQNSTLEWLRRGRADNVTHQVQTPHTRSEATDIPRDFCPSEK